jgi:HlyD family secretion protein
MFPVLISIGNEQGLLLPGMNGEVSVLVDERTNVLAVPVDAVRAAREIPAVATALGLDADSVRAQVERQVASRFQSGRRGGAADTAVGAAMEAPSSGRRGQRDSLGAAGRGSGRGGLRRRSGGGEPRGRGFGEVAVGGDSMRRRGAGGFGAGGEAAPGRGGGGLAGGAGGAGRPQRAGRAQVAFVRTSKGLEPRVVQLGISNFDYAEVLGGVEEGEEVVLLSVAELQAKRAQDQSRIRQRMGSGLPGSAGGGGSGRGAGGR